MNLVFEKMTQIWSHVAFLIVLELWCVTECIPVESKNSSSDDSQIPPYICSGISFSMEKFKEYKKIFADIHKTHRSPTNGTITQIAMNYLTGGQHFYMYPDDMLTEQELAERHPNEARHSDICSDDACHFSVVFGKRSPQQR